jgi:hypothetical protein
LQPHSIDLVKEKYHHRVFAIVLLALFAAYYANVSFFYHCHTVGGVTIVHSHMHSSDHSGTEVSESEVTLIAALSLFQTFAAALFSLATVASATHEIILCKPSPRRLFARLTGCISLRAPPAVY